MKGSRLHSGPRSGSVSVSVWWVRLLYVAVYSSYGATSVYRTLYYRRIGLSATEIGALIAVQPLIMLASGPVWSLAADRLGLRSRLLTVVTALGVLPMVATAAATRFPTLLALAILHSFFQGPVQPLMDSAALAALGRQRHRYATIRAFGSLGYAPVAWVTGLFIQGHDIRWIFAGYALLMGTGSALSLRLPTDQHQIPASIGRGLGSFVRNRAWLAFGLALFVALMAQGVTFGYSALYLDTLGASEGLIGLNGAVGSLSQTLLMLTVLPWLLRRWGSQRLMILSLVAFGLRCGVWSLFPDPTIVASTSVFLGFTYGATLVASVEFADKHSPEGLEATSQAVVSGLVSGLGRSSGSMIGGSLYDSIGPQSTFGVFATSSLVAALCFGVLWGRRSKGARR